MDQNILDTLQNIGLTPGEAKVYLASLSVGTSSVGAIIDKSGVSASKVYQILDRLMEKGLASMVVKQGLKLFTAADPNQILTFMDEQQQKIELHKEKAKEILPQLIAKKESQTKQPVVEMVRGERGFINFYTEQKNAAHQGDSYVAIAGSRMSFRFQKYWYEHSTLLSEKNIKQFLVYEHGGWNNKDPRVHRRKERKLYYPVVLKESIEDLPNILCLGNRVVIQDEDEEGFFGLIIRNKKLTHAFMKLIKVLRMAGVVPKGFQEEELLIA